MAANRFLWRAGGENAKRQKAIRDKAHWNCGACIAKEPLVLVCGRWFVHTHCCNAIWRLNVAVHIRRLLVHPPQHVSVADHPLLMLTDDMMCVYYTACFKAGRPGSWRKVSAGFVCQQPLLCWALTVQQAERCEGPLLRGHARHRRWQQRPSRVLPAHSRPARRATAATAAAPCRGPHQGTTVQTCRMPPTPLPAPGHDTRNVMQQAAGHKCGALAEAPDALSAPQILGQELPYRLAALPA
jgi:hypothetical protein